MRILRWLAQPSRHLGPVRSLPLWRASHFLISCTTISSLWACQIALAVKRCEFLRSLVQPSRHFGPVRSLSLCRGANFEIARATCANFAIAPATLSSLWACQISPAVAQCSFCNRLCSLLVTLGLSDRSCGGGVLILMVKEILRRDLDREVSSRELAHRSCTECSYRDLLQRSCQEASYRALARRAPIGSLYRDLARPPFMDTSHRDIA